MRSVLILIVVFLLPLQFAWASAAAYCQHETAGQHFGHHQHDHPGGSLKSTSDADRTSLAGTDDDCTFCQLSALYPIAPEQSHVVDPFASWDPSGYHVHSYSYSPPRLERPDRILAA